MDKTVVLVQLEAGSADAAAFERALQGIEGLDLRFARGELALAHAPETEVLVGSFVPDDFLARAERLRWVSFTSAGVDGKLTPTLLERSPRITSAIGVHGPNVAEHVMALMLALTHGFPLHFRDQKAKLWRDWSGSRAQGHEVFGQTLAIVGLGHIGAAVAERAKAFHMRVAAVKREPLAPAEGLHEGSVDVLLGPPQLDAVIGAADHVVLCAPATPDTRKLFDAARFAKLKPGTWFYNVSRGSLVDTAALVAALESGGLAGAGLDVFEEEPLPKASPLWELPNVLITPHVAGLTPRYYERAATLFAANLRHYLTGGPLAQEYDPKRGY